jgi:hypothetical protein
MLPVSRARANDMSISCYQYVDHPVKCSCLTTNILSQIREVRCRSQRFFGEHDTIPAIRSRPACFMQIIRASHGLARLGTCGNRCVVRLPDTFNLGGRRDRLGLFNSA